MAKSEAPQAAKSKMQIVRELMQRGLSGPKEISETAKAEFQAEISPAYVSTIKNGMKSRSGVRRNGHRARGAVRAAAPKRVAEGGDLSLENLALRFALKAGGVEAAIAALKNLQQ